MTIHKTLSPRDDVDRLHVSRKEGGRGPTRIENSVNASTQGLEDYIHRRGGKVIKTNGNITDSMWTY